MCDHPISNAVLKQHRGPVKEMFGDEFACAAYAAHARELHRTLLFVVECEHCTDLLVAHSFLARPASHGVQPTLVQLIRTALVLACDALGGTARQELQGRIRAWNISLAA